MPYLFPRVNFAAAQSSGHVFGDSIFGEVIQAHRLSFTHLLQRNCEVIAQPRLGDKGLFAAWTLVGRSLITMIVLEMASDTTSAFGTVLFVRRKDKTYRSSAISEKGRLAQFS